MRLALKTVGCKICGAPISAFREGRKMCGDCRKNGAEASRAKRKEADVAWSRARQKAEVTKKDVDAALKYNPETGVFTWASDGRGRRRAGKAAGGSNSCGYVQICLNGKNTLAHRLVFLVMTGAEPAGGMVVDHIDGDRSNNSWANLRLADRRQNAANRVPSRKNMVGASNVRWEPHRGKWAVKVAKKHVGRFGTLAEAIEARRRASIEKWGDYSLERSRGEVA